jgi:acetyl-CoA carboxylase biotin carboxyl carrier protein
VTDETRMDEVFAKAQDLAGSAGAAGRPPRRMKVQSGDVVVEMEWPEGETPPPAPVSAPAEPGEAGEAAPPAAEAGRTQICAPLVGTFYHAPEPGEPPFVKPGDVVEPGQQVGIVEAMKLMNPIEAEEGGRVAEVLVPNETAVEYGQPLIALDPLD